MKITSKDLTLIGITAVITAAVIVGVIVYLDKSIAPIDEGVSDRVDSTYVMDRRREYTSFEPLYVKYPVPGTPRDSIEVLQGFLFEAEHLREIITTNSSIKGNPDTVIFYLGQDGTFMDSSTTPPTRRGNLNLIAIGLKNDTLLLDAKAGTKASLFDKAMPCPPYCPR